MKAHLWVDFNRVDESLRTTSLMRLATDKDVVVVDAMIDVEDDDGNTCRARVIAIRPDGVVDLALDGATFQSADERDLAVAT